MASKRVAVRADMMALEWVAAMVVTMVHQKADGWAADWASSLAANLVFHAAGEWAGKWEWNPVETMECQVVVSKAEMTEQIAVV